MLGLVIKTTLCLIGTLREGTLVLEQDLWGGIIS